MTVATRTETVDQTPGDEELPRLGDLVLYVLSGSDIDRLIRPPGASFGMGTAGVANPYLGSVLDVGAVAVALVVQTYSPDLVSLQVFPDGAGAPLWCPSRVRGSGVGEWSPRP